MNSVEDSFKNKRRNQVIILVNAMKKAGAEVENEVLGIAGFRASHFGELACKFLHVTVLLGNFNQCHLVEGFGAGGRMGGCLHPLSAVW